MPGPDITRLRNRARAARFVLFTFVIWAGVLLAMPVRPQSSQPQNDVKPATAPSSTAPSAAPSQAPASSPQTPPKKDEHDQKLNDQGVFVFRKDVDEVLLHASVIDDKQHIVTTLERG